jgi:hypothetical protein
MPAALDDRRLGTGLRAQPPSVIGRRLVGFDDHVACPKGDSPLGQVAPAGGGDEAPRRQRTWRLRAPNDVRHARPLLAGVDLSQVASQIPGCPSNLSPGRAENTTVSRADPEEAREHRLAGALSEP